MSDYGLVLEASREDRRIKVSIYEKGEGVERTLRPYEDFVVPWEQVEGGAAEITTLLNRANRRGKVASDILHALKKTGQLLFDLLVPSKASQKLNASTATSLILYIDDKLVYIPWELLFDGREFLCRRFAMGRIVSTSQVPTALAKRSLKRPLKVLVLADPRQDLKAAYKEGVEIRDLLDGERNSFEVDFRSHPVDISFVKKNLRDYDIVHYAGHADYDTENPSESGWLLTDGRLRASEISAMGGLPPMPFLVFSNACQTGQSGAWQIHEGFEQEIFGLANAYLVSGVQHYIGTFWEILDEPSSHFAKRFYSFITQGLNIGEAVRRAREELIQTYGEETIVWASYMLYGDPTFAFADAGRKAATESAERETAQAGWRQVMRGNTTAATSVVRVGSSRFLYPLMGVLLLGMAFLGYFFLHPRTVQLGTLGPPSVSPPEGASKSGAEIARMSDAPAEAGAKKSEDTVTVKGTSSNTIARSKGASQAEATKTEQTIPPMATNEQVVSKQEATVAAVASPFTLSVNIIGQRKEADGSYTEVLVSEGSILRSYDNFQVHLETSRPAYIYVLLYDSQGKASQIFPDPKIDQPGFAEGGRKLVVPAKDLWFWLDENTGTETIYVLASEKPMADIKGFLAKMETVNEAGKQRVSQEIKQRIAIMQRGVGGITKGQPVTYTLSDGKKIQKVTEVVTGTGSVVRAMSFLHR